MKDPKSKTTKKLFEKTFWLSKKFLISTCIIAVLIIGGIIGLVAVKKQTLYKTALNNIAEVRYYLKSAENTKLRVQFFSGKREEPYEQDGTAKKETDFAIVNVDPKDNSLKDFTQLEGTIRIGEEQIPITLIRNPYDRNFAIDIARNVDKNKEVSVTLFISSTDHPTFALQNAMGENAVSWQDALRTATEKCSAKVSKAKSFEVYVKIISDIAQDAGAFWYIQFITDEGKTHFCVVAPDGSVIE